MFVNEWTGESVKNLSRRRCSGGFAENHCIQKEVTHILVHEDECLIIPLLKWGDGSKGDCKALQLPVMGLGAIVISLYKGSITSVVGDGHG
jgi:hypothetical protein